MVDGDMPRKSVINRVAESHNITKIDAERILCTVMDAVAEQLTARGRFHIAEIGSITVAERPPRRYFNPRTKTEAVSRGDLSLKMNISKQMRERIKG